MRLMTEEKPEFESQMCSDLTFKAGESWEQETNYHACLKDTILPRTHYYSSQNFQKYFSSSPSQTPPSLPTSTAPCKSLPVGSCLKVDSSFIICFVHLKYLACDTICYHKCHQESISNVRILPHNEKINTQKELTWAIHKSSSFLSGPFKHFYFHFVFT